MAKIKTRSEITMQHIRTLNLLFSGTPQFRFNRKQNKLFLDIDWTRDVDPGDYVIMECYRKLSPDTIQLTGTVSLDNTSKTVTGTNTIFDQEVLENDIVNFNGEPIQIRRINSPTELILVDLPTTSNAVATMEVAGMSDVWDDRFLKSYATAKIKYQWGTNLSKFAGIQLPGGVTLDGPRIMEEALTEIEKLEEQMHVVNVLPSEIFLG
jgi:hypothetical protein